jgi:hypothetical protein
MRYRFVKNISVEQKTFASGHEIDGEELHAGHLDTLVRTGHIEEIPEAGETKAEDTESDVPVPKKGKKGKKKTAEPADDADSDDDEKDE